MTGQPATIIFAASFFILILYTAKRMFNLPNMKKQQVETEMIARKDQVYGCLQTQNTLRAYFRGVFRMVAIVASCLFLSSMSFLFMLLTIKTGGTPSPLWQIVLFVFILSFPGYMVLGIKLFDTIVLRNDVMDRFNDHQEQKGD